MKRQTKKRLANLAEILGSVPIPEEVRKPAFEHFRKTGVLPDDERLAVAVISRAQTGYDCVWSHGEFNWAASIETAMSTPKRKPDPLLDELYNEAILGEGLIRFAARYVLEMFVSLGKDVTEPIFLDWDPEVPNFGSVGLHLLGFPDLLVQPPYEEQAQRLVDRTADLRSRLPDRGRKWAKVLVDAIEDWRSYGELPEDELLREAILIEGETAALLDHLVGKDVGAVMAAYDQVERTRHSDDAVRDLLRHIA